MDKIPVNIEHAVKQYINNLKKTNIDLQKIILFGSYVNGNYKDYSDIDIAIVSKDFSGIRYDDRIKVGKATLKSDPRIEPHPISYEDYKSPNPFVEEILKTGIVIYN